MPTLLAARLRYRASELRISCCILQASSASMDGNTNKVGETLSGCLTRDVSDVGAAYAEVRQLPFAEAFKLSNGLAVREPALDLSENKRHQHGQGASPGVRMGPRADST
jgi:hypothetical protein